MPVVITGAGRGLGRGYARYLARQGAHVVVNDRDDVATEVAEEIVAAGGTAVAVIGSVTDWDFAGHLIDRALSEFGWLHGVVANAGTYHVTAALEESPEQIRASVDSNLIGTLHVGIHALRHLVPARSGVVITTTSSAALGLEGASTYSAMKGALMSLTYSWAIEVEGTGVRVNCVRPRAQTRMSLVRTGVPRGDGTEPEEIAPVVAYLLDDRSADLNGQVLGFDGTILELVHRARPVELRTSADWTIDSMAAAVAAASAESP